MHEKHAVRLRLACGSIFCPASGGAGGWGLDNSQILSIFLSGRAGFLSASTLLGAAGVVWGIYDSMKTPGASGAPTAVGAPPPIPGAASPSTASDMVSSEPIDLDVLRIVRLAVSAARADGTLLPAERALILSHAREAGVESIVEAELAHAAFTIVRADEHVSGAERIYLAQLAHQLGLDRATVASLEGDTATRIDASDDSGAVSPAPPVPPLP